MKTDYKTINTIDLGAKLRVGISWQYGETIFNSAFSFASGIILARLLDPADFGVFAAVTAFTSILLLQVNFGWPAALLQTKKLQEPLLSSIFWVMLGVALLVTLLVLGCSNFLGGVYEDARFKLVMTLFCIQFFITPFNTINGSILRWAMRYDLVSRISMVTMVVSTCVGVAAAFGGLGVYSLVLAGIFASFLRTIGMAFYAPWKPSLIFSWPSIRPVFAFAWRVHLTRTLNMISSRIDNMMIGKFVGIGPLGLYVKAFSLGRMPIDLLATNLYQIFFTALSRIQDTRSQSILMFQKMIVSVTFATYLPLVLLILLGEGLVVNLYGQKWSGAVLPMQIMAIGCFAAVISMICGAFCEAQNLVDKEIKVQAANVFLTIAAVIIGAKWDLIGVAAGISIKAFVLLILIKKVLATGIRLTWTDLFHPVWPQVTASTSALFAGLAVISLLAGSYASRNLWQMGLIALASTVAYFTTWILLASCLVRNIPLTSVLALLKTSLNKWTRDTSFTQA